MKDLLGIQLETTTACQASCVFCPRGKLKEHGTMEDGLYEKIICEAAQLPALGILNIQGNAGEPLCDAKFLDRLEYARSRLNGTALEFYTNGSLLNERMIDRLKGISDLRINVSLNGGPETRKRLMGLDDYWHVVRMMGRLREAGIPNRASMVAYPEVTLGEISDFIASGGLAIQYQSWAGKQYRHERRRWTSCNRAMHHVYIRFNGDMTLCCFDTFGDVTFGNLKENTIAELWGSEGHREYVSKHKQGRGNELALCCSCSEG